MKKSLGIWIVRPEAQKLGLFLSRSLKADLLPKNFPASKNREAFVRLYPSYRQWLLVMTTGISVRYLQGLPKDKKTDPAVVVVDEAARFAVSLLSGHEGGANDLAYRVAELTGATPVITTATESLKSVVLGIGCRRGIPAEAIHQAAQTALKKVGKSLKDVREVATIDLKRDEKGLVDWCSRNDLPLRSFNRSTINGRPWVTKASPWVRKNVGVDGVCEPCALLASHNGSLILPKTAHSGVTIAIVEEPRPFL